jgi:hypothetical protein
MFNHIISNSDWGQLRLALVLVVVLFAAASAAAARMLETWHRRHMRRRQLPRKGSRAKGASWAA